MISKQVVQLFFYILFNFLILIFDREIYFNLKKCAYLSLVVNILKILQGNIDLYIII